MSGGCSTRLTVRLGRGSRWGGGCLVGERKMRTTTARHGGARAIVPSALCGSTREGPLEEGGATPLNSGPRLRGGPDVNRLAQRRRQEYGTWDVAREWATKISARWPKSVEQRVGGTGIRRHERDGLRTLPGLRRLLMAAKLARAELSSNPVATLPARSAGAQSRCAVIYVDERRPSGSLAPPPRARTLWRGLRIDDKRTARSCTPARPGERWALQIPPLIRGTRLRCRSPPLTRGSQTWFQITPTSAGTTLQPPALRQ
jgi:hypothetical protein